jgi:hypothetical protein
MQTAYPTDNTRFRCIPSGTLEMSRDAGADGGAVCAVADPSNRTILDCDKMFLCEGPAVYGVCECNAAGCQGDTHNVRDLTATFEGGVIKGNLTISGGLAYKIELLKN